MTTTSITRDYFYPQAPEHVWQALTNRAEIAKWLMPNDFEPRLGHQFTFQTNPMPAIGFDGVCHCEVTELNPPRLLAYTWNGGKLRSLVTYRLESEGEGTHLFFEHSGFDLSDPAQAAAHQGMQGWSGALDSALRREVKALEEAAQA